MSAHKGNPALRVIVIVLAVIGAIAVIALVGMAVMHNVMMGGGAMSGMASMMAMRGGMGC